MIRVLLISSLIFLSLGARENPFFPSDGERDILITSNEESDTQPLKRAAITLPSQARVLQKVTIEFKNLDGSVESKSIELSNKVDWHIPIFITQSYAQQENSTQLQAVQQVQKSVPKKESYKNIASIEYLSLLSYQKSLKLVTKDRALRNFMLVNPHRLVIDFKRDSNMKSYVKKIPNSIFKEVRIGNHDGYYRAVIELDGLYRYGFKKIAEGYLIELK
ncbi:AMIN domain-containing protein [Sulfurimonas crateris]|uniref:AMIN domain-containing protein n=1 Tax=Sulfurimonas crateris TaxID=2574727 RepID=A0A4U2Z4D1_9BACT|nr:AMIN domain-containing protein [Sulfurimonas crateris]TKI68605.1 AMIN domain-containing protein [Sulfurimonas crateris]